MKSATMDLKDNTHEQYEKYSLHIGDVHFPFVHRLIASWHFPALVFYWHPFRDPFIHHPRLQHSMQSTLRRLRFIQTILIRGINETTSTMAQARTNFS